MDIVKLQFQITNYKGIFLFSFFVFSPFFFNFFKVETCKKRWKYLRERYVQQRKQGDPPNYEHLSRPYLDKMKFLDKHIQPRKSYKQVSSFLSSPNANGSFTEFMDSSR